MAPEPIAVTGLKEFVKALKQTDTELPKQVRLANNSAADLIVTKAKPKVPSGSAQAGHAVSSIKAKSTRTEGRVVGGGSKYPYYPWLDFGGSAGRNKKVKRYFLTSGRYIFPAYSQNAGAVYRGYVEALLGVARSAGLEMENGS